MGFAEKAILETIFFKIKEKNHKGIIADFSLLQRFINILGEGMAEIKGLFCSEEGVQKLINAYMELVRERKLTLRGKNSVLYREIRITQRPPMPQRFQRRLEEAVEKISDTPEYRKLVY